MDHVPVVKVFDFVQGVQIQEERKIQLHFCFFWLQADAAEDMDMHPMIIADIGEHCFNTTLNELPTNVVV